jgi:hypothetical protein
MVWRECPWCCLGATVLVLRCVGYGSGGGHGGGGGYNHMGLLLFTKNVNDISLNFLERYYVLAFGVDNNRRIFHGPLWCYGVAPVLCRARQLRWLRWRWW